MTRDELLAIAREPNVAAFLHVLRFCEGTLGDRGYQTIYGYRFFDSFADHPRVKVTAGAYTSSAAGAYQFIESTWDEMAAKYALPDFSPASQDAAAVGLLIRRGALDAIRAGDLATAIELTNREWASLPGSPYGQPTRKIADIQTQWQTALARSAPIEDRSVRAQEEPVAPIVAALAPSFVGALIQQLMGVAPELAKIFTDKTTPVNERNVAAGMKVLEAAQRATGTTSPAQAVEQIVTDVTKVEPFRKEVAPLIELIEVGGGIPAAREATRVILGMGGWQAIGYGALVAIIAVGVVIGGGAFMGWVLMKTDVKPEVVAQVLDYFKAAGFIVLGYLFGTSRSSQRKDDVILGKMGG